MSIGVSGEGLVFLISQPRAGSTLLQRMLGNHPEIHTVSEPWLMLHPLYALRPEGREAEYNAQWAGTAVRGFLQTLPGGEDEYWEGVRCMYQRLYQSAMRNTGCRYFLDKTPRYYFVIPELYRVFPEADFIILLRNPLAVLCSILKTWVTNDWSKVSNFARDLVDAPVLLLRGIQLLGARALAVHYEQLVRSPDVEVSRICNRLRLDLAPEMVDYGLKPDPGWRFGDQVGIRKHKRPDPEAADGWTEALDDPQVWRLCSDYLRLLGPRTMQELGYSHESLQVILNSHRPHARRSWLTFSLSSLLDTPRNPSTTWKSMAVHISSSIRQRGFRRTITAGLGRMTHASSIRD